MHPLAWRRNDLSATKAGTIDTSASNQPISHDLRTTRVTIFIKKHLKSWVMPHRHTFPGNMGSVAVYWSHTNWNSNSWTSKAALHLEDSRSAFIYSTQPVCIEFLCVLGTVPSLYIIVFSVVHEEAAVGWGSTKVFPDSMRFVRLCHYDYPPRGKRVWKRLCIWFTNAHCKWCT